MELEFDDNILLKILMNVVDLKTISSFAQSSKRYNKITNESTIWALNLFPNLLNIKIINFENNSNELSEINWKDSFKKIHKTRYKSKKKNNLKILCFFFAGNN